MILLNQKQEPQLMIELFVILIMFENERLILN